MTDYGGAYEDGYSDGYEQGHQQGHAEGHEISYPEGYEIGRAEGCAIGFEEGHSQGYREAWDLCRPARNEPDDENGDENGNENLEEDFSEDMINQNMDVDADIDATELFKQEVLLFFPSIPSEHLDNLVKDNIFPNSTRVGANRSMDIDKRVRLAVKAYIRHDLTEYDELAGNGMGIGEARIHIRRQQNKMLVLWSGGTYHHYHELTPHEVHWYNHAALMASVGGSTQVAGVHATHRSHLITRKQPVEDQQNRVGEDGLPVDVEGEEIDVEEDDIDVEGEEFDDEDYQMKEYEGDVRASEMGSYNKAEPM